MDEEPEFDGGQTVTEDNILLSCVLGFKSGEFLALGFIELRRVGIEDADCSNAFVYHLGNLLIQLMNIFSAEKARADTQLDIEDVVKVVEVPLLRNASAYDYWNWSI